MGVIQDTMTAQEEYGFTGTPLTGVNKLVSQFTITGFGEQYIQDIYDTGSIDVIQDVYDA